MTDTDSKELKEIIEYRKALMKKERLKPSYWARSLIYRMNMPLIDEMWGSVGFCLLHLSKEVHELRKEIKRLNDEIHLFVLEKDQDNDNRKYEI